MKFCTYFIAYVLATTVCMAKRPRTLSSRRKEREERRRKLSFSNLVQHTNNEVRSRSSIMFGDNNIIGVYFKPIYEDEQLNTESEDGLATPRDIPGDEVSIPPTPVASPTLSTLNPVPKSMAKNMRNGGGGAKRNGLGNGGGGAKRNGGGGAKRNGGGTRKRGGLMRGGGNRNGVKRTGSSSPSASKAGSKSGSKEGSKFGKADGFRTKNAASECRQLCEGVPFGQEFPEPTCNVNSISEFANIAADSCCCSQGISFLKLRINTSFYTANPKIGGSFKIVNSGGTTGTATDPRDPTIDITTPSAAAKQARGRARGNGRNKRKNVANAATESKEDPLKDGTTEKIGPMDEPPLNGAREIYLVEESPTEISRVDGSAESIRVVDCSDDCLRSPATASARTVCDSAREEQDQVSEETEICIIQVDDENFPRFDWNFPPILTVRFKSTMQEEFYASIDTSCGSPVVSPWAVIATAGNPPSQPMHINLNALNAGSFLMFVFDGGLSTGSFLDARSMGSLKEAGYQLGQGECGCNCDDFPPTEPPTTSEETNTLPPTIDWSCAPTETEEAGGSQRDIPFTDSPTMVERFAVPIANAGTEESPGTDDVETGPPTVVFNVASPTVPATPSPTKTPTSPPTDLPTIKPSASPSTAPTAKPTATPTVTPSVSESELPTDAPDGGLTKIEEAAVLQIESACGTREQKSIYDYVCSVNNFSNFCRMIERAGLVEVMDGIDGKTPFITLFAPTNKGCTASGLSLDQIKTMDTTLLKHIVLTHATTGKISAESLQCNVQLPTLEGTFSVHSTKCFPNYAKAQIGFFNSEDDYPMILAPNDLELCNGYVQPVNNVIRAINF